MVKSTNLFFSPFVLLIVKSFLITSSFGAINRTICFQSHDVNERGVDVAIFDYADYNEKILGYRSLMLIPDNPKARKGASLPKLIERFGDGVVFYKPDEYKLSSGKIILVPGKNLPIDAKKAGCDLIYIQKAGDKLGVPRYPEAFNNA